LLSRQEQEAGAPGHHRIVAKDKNSAIKAVTSFTLT
jgi:hypothetical protein